MKRACILAAGLVLAAGCGPSEAEVGSAIVHAAPLMVIIGFIVQWIYARLWRAFDDGVELPRVHTLVALGLSLLAMIPAYLRVGVDGDDWFMALCLAGASYLAFLLVAMRLLIRGGASYGLAVWFAWSLIIVPGFLFAVIGPTDKEANLVIALALPGYLGIVPGVISALLGIELGVRFHRKRKAARPPPPVPPARVVER